MNFTADDFAAQRNPRFGRANPEAVDVPFWTMQIRSGDTAWAGRQHVLGGASSACEGGPTWSFDRFGTTFARLPDGRAVCIAGEHEDHYDPDFHIYNDVIVFSPGGGFQVYLYPREIFPPTDFHATVWVEPYLYVIGSLGHQQDAAQAPLYRLDTRDWSFEAIRSDGYQPPRLHQCFARLDAAEQAIRVFGGCWYPPGGRTPMQNEREQWFDLRTMTWREGPANALAPPPPFGERIGKDLLAVREYAEAYKIVDVIRRTLPLDHVLWASDLWPLYANLSQALVRVDDTPGRYAICELEWGQQRSPSGVRTRVIDGELGELEQVVTDPKSFNQWGQRVLTARLLFTARSFGAAPSESAK